MCGARGMSEMYLCSAQFSCEEISLFLKNHEFQNM